MLKFFRKVSLEFDHIKAFLIKNNKHKKTVIYINKLRFLRLSSGPDGTRTRDPLRDRQVF